MIKPFHVTVEGLFILGAEMAGEDQDNDGDHLTSSRRFRVNAWRFVARKAGHIAQETQFRADNIESEALRQATHADLDVITSSVEEFRKYSKDLAETVSSPSYREIVETYFLLKQSVALFEAYQKELPLQVFNEMRNALDHFVRSLVAESIVPQDATEEETERMHAERTKHETRNLVQTKGHLTRAMLDAFKLTCGFLDDDIKLRHLRFSDKAIGLVNNGEYVKEITRLHEVARSTFIEARKAEFRIGTHEEPKVLELYLQAAVAHRRAHQYQSEHYSKLTWAKYVNVPESLLFALIGAVATEVLTHLAGMSIYEMLSGTFDWFVEIAFRHQF